MTNSGLRIEVQLLPVDNLRCSLCSRSIPSARDLDGEEYGYEWVPVLLAGAEVIGFACGRCVALRLKGIPS
jgi:hypothetical protein